MRQKIIDMISDINPYVEVTETSELLEDGILDSIGIVLLITELEEHYGVKIPVESLRKEDFVSVETISELVRSVM